MSSPNPTPFETVDTFVKSRFSELHVVIVRPLNSEPFIALQRWDRKTLAGELQLRHGNAGIPMRLVASVAAAIERAARHIEGGAA